MITIGNYYSGTLKKTKKMSEVFLNLYDLYRVESFTV